MLNLNLENLFSISKEHGLNKNDLIDQEKNISKYLENIEQRNQGFYKIIDRDFDEIKSFAQKVQGKYDDIIILGIGGSSLGMICLQQSLKHLFDSEFPKEKRTTPRLHVLDNIDPVLIKEVEDIIDYSRTLFIVITKSGTTPETLSQYFYFRNQSDQQNLDPKDHFVFVTDPEKSLLLEIGKKEGITLFEIPQNVGGRFSVLTAVGLLPAALIGINIDKLLEGARNMRDNFLSKSFEKNLPFQIATIQYLLSKKDKSINVVIPYAQKLIKFADWYRQLLAESIGKAVNNQGEKVNVGLTPINALGVTDQHSQSQLYNEGPNDKFFIFINVKNLGPEIKIPKLLVDPSLEYLNNVSFNKLIETEMHGTIGSLNSNDRPNITIEIPEVNEHALGELFLLFEGATAFLGEYFNINAFDQPGVELSKNITKELLLKDK